MSTTIPSDTDAEVAKKEIEIHLTEFQKLREEVMFHVQSQHQTMLVLLGSASVILPLIVGQTSTIDNKILSAVLYVVSIAYSIAALNFATSLFAMEAISIYTSKHIGPRINKILYHNGDQRVLQWESFIRHERKKTIPSILAMIGPLGSVLSALVPGTLSILIGKYIQNNLNGSINNVTSMSSLHLSESSLNIILVVAVIFYSTAIVAQMIAVFYTLRHAKWSYQPIRNQKKKSLQDTDID